MTAATVSFPASAGPAFGPKNSHSGLTAYTLSHAWLTAETDEANDTVEFGYLPGGVTVVGFCNYTADLDSGTAYRQTIKIGTTSVLATDDLASGGGGEFWAITPQVLTAPTLVSAVTTTGATGHQNGTQYLTFFYYSS